MTAASSPTLGPTTTRGSRSGCLSKIACSVSARSLPIGRNCMAPSSIHRMPGAAAAGPASPVVECVPNVSEGRDRALIETLAAAIRAAPGVTLANVHADPDHHRSVVSFLGGPEAVDAAPLALPARVVALLDMRHHPGIPPPLGAPGALPVGPPAGVTAAREIAGAVRESSGGLPSVQAMGVPLASRGIAQVSMNLLDHRRTPIPVVFDRVVDEARRRRTGVSRSELVGLAPRAAFGGRTPESVGLENFTSELYPEAYPQPDAPPSGCAGPSSPSPSPRLAPRT